MMRPEIPRASSVDPERGREIRVTDIAAKVIANAGKKRETFTLLASSSQRQHNNITPVYGLLFVTFFIELPLEGTVQQKGN